MLLVEQHIIKQQHPFFKECDDLCFKSKNLYNSGLYAVRQHFFNEKQFLNGFSLINKFTNENNVDYKNLPSKVSQQTLKIVEQNFKSFFGALKSKKNGNNDRKIKIPNYLDKIKGRQIVIYTNQTFSIPLLKQSIIKLSQTNIQFKTFVPTKDIQQVRIVPKNGHYVIEVIYKKEIKASKQDNKRYSSIDLGLNNLATVGSNVMKPFIINGKPLKSINQFYNKKLAKLQSNLKEHEKSTNRIKRLHFKRNNKIKDYLHKSSRCIINQLVSNSINTLIIGHNKEWKQEINIGSVNNQKFVSIPHSRFIDMLKYKASLEGINVILQEESYTSKCSFLDNEPIQKHESYKGTRIKRGLFKSKERGIINADVNGSLNILRKAVGNAFNKANSIEVSSSPLRIKSFL
jgi:putative transposase